MLYTNGMRKPTDTQLNIIKQNTKRILAEDKARIDEVLSGQGWRYFVAALLIFPLSLIKVFDFILNSPHLWRDYASENQDTEHKRLEGAVGLSAYKFNDKRVIYNEYRDSLEDYNKEAVRTIYSRDIVTNNEAVYEHAMTESRLDKATVIQQLQEIFEKDERLEGVNLRTKYLDNGKIESRRVTFGNKMNSMLKALFPSLKLLNLKGSTDTYLLFEGGSMFDFEQRLRNTFLKPVTIMLKRVSRKKP